MFHQATPAPPTSPGIAESAADAPALPTSATSPTATAAAPHAGRHSRLRGLSYLRNYTHTHRASREQSNSNGPPAAGSLSPVAIAVTAATRGTIGSPLTRSTSESGAALLGTARQNHSLQEDEDPEPDPAALRIVATTGQQPSPSPAGATPKTSSKRASIFPRTRSGNTSASTSSNPLHLTKRRGSDDQTNRTAAATVALSPEETNRPNMTRSRAVTNPATTLSTPRGQNGSANMPAAATTATTGSHEQMPSIRFTTFLDPRATRPSLTFSPISRTLPSSSEIIRVGRYSERDNTPAVPINAPSAAPVGFKSKVVSRRHCEFWFEGGKWYIKDVKSSSGTFLNHIRLSSPGTESRPYAVNDGDIVQLGIDFKGGEEMIFRCVKMRLELNRGWQNKLNAFNMNTHKRLRNMTTSSGAGNSQSSYSQDCSICLNSIAPCQCLFVAPCSHTWHYKCIRALLQGPTFPIFVCPNCRATADLEADVEEPEEWELPPESVDGQEAGSSEGTGTSGDRANSASLAVQPPAAPRRSRDSDRRAIPAALLAPQPPAPQQPAQANDDAADEQDPMDVTMQFYPNGNGDSEMEDPDQEHNEHDDGDDAVSATNGNGARTPTQAPSSHATSIPMAIPPAQGSLNGRGGIRTPSPDENGVVLNGTEGPITPRNDAGPWVFDGSGVRLRGVAGAATEAAGSSALPAMPSLDAAAVTAMATNMGGQKASRKRDAETTSL